MHLTYQGTLAQRRKVTYGHQLCQYSPALVLLHYPMPTLTINNTLWERTDTYTLIRVGKITDSNWDTQGSQVCFGIIHLRCQFIWVYRLVE